jgi:thiazole synthase ThiGH ThiG subunit
MTGTFSIAGRTFTSRLIVGTGKYPSHQIMRDAHVASGTEMVTVAVRRVDLSARGEASLLSWIDREKDFPAAEHCRLLHRRRGRAHRAARAGGRPLELDQA